MTSPMKRLTSACVRIPLLMCIINTGIFQTGMVLVKNKMKERKKNRRKREGGREEGKERKKREKRKKKKENDFTLLYACLPFFILILEARNCFYRKYKTPLSPFWIFKQWFQHESIPRKWFVFFFTLFHFFLSVVWVPYDLINGLQTKC